MSSTPDAWEEVRLKREEMRGHWDMLRLGDAGRAFALISASCHVWNDPRQTDTPREVLVSIAALAIAAAEVSWPAPVEEKSDE